MNRHQDLTKEKLERMRREINGGVEYQPNLPVDPYDQAHHRAEALRGRDREAWDKWRRVMEYHGFIWLEPGQLTKVIGPLKVTIWGSGGTAYVERPHTKGQWRRFTAPGRRKYDQKWALGLQMDDLLTLFVDPEDFDNWIRLRDGRTRARETGLVLMPDSLRRQKYRGATQVSVPDNVQIVNPNAPEQPVKKANQQPKPLPERD